MTANLVNNKRLKSKNPKKLTCLPFGMFCFRIVQTEKDFHEVREAEDKNPFCNIRH